MKRVKNIEDLLNLNNLNERFSDKLKIASMDARYEYDGSINDYDYNDLIKYINKLFESRKGLYSYRDYERPIRFDIKFEIGNEYKKIEKIIDDYFESDLDNIIRSVKDSNLYFAVSRVKSITIRPVDREYFKSKSMWDAYVLEKSKIVSDFILKLILDFIDKKILKHNLNIEKVIIEFQRNGVSDLFIRIKDDSDNIISKIDGGFI